MKKYSFSSLLAAMLLFVAGNLFSQSPTISVQGVLTKSDGTAVDDGQYSLTFRLWNDPAGGIKKHEENINNVDVVGGVYSVVLGINGFGSANFTETYYLGVSVGGSSVEFLPRPRLTSAPYAIGILGSTNTIGGSGVIGVDGVKANGGIPLIPSAVQGYSFRGSGDQDGGLFSYADNQVSLYTDGTERLKIANGLTEIVTPNTNTNNLFVYGYAHSQNGFFYHSNGANTGQQTGVAVGNGLSTLRVNNQDRVLCWNDNNNYFRTPSNSGGLNIFDQGDVRVGTQLFLNGNVTSDFGDINFSKPIEVLGSAFYPIVNWTTYGNGGNTSSNGNISGKFSGDVAAGAFLAFSDHRIKKDVSRVSPSESLAKLQKLQVADYRFIDEVARGKGVQKGFIAQEVESVEPEAVFVSTGFVPSVYAASERVEIRGEQVVLKMAKPHGLQKGERVRIFDAANKHQDMEVREANGTEFTVSKWNNATAENAFVFGKEVSDFRAVDYDHIFTMNVAATQELARRVEILEKENAALRGVVEGQLSELSKKVKSLEGNASANGRK